MNSLSTAHLLGTCLLGIIAASRRSMVADAWIVNGGFNPLHRSYPRSFNTRSMGTARTQFSANPASQARYRDASTVGRGDSGVGASSMVATSPAKARRKQNVDGNLFVDDTCIDCDTCRWMQGETFARDEGQSAVIRQPQTEEEKRGAYRAMFACPTSSIRVETADPLAKEALTDFPFPVDTERLPGVSHLGFHDENSYGCSPWLVEREGPEGQKANVMMDSPRFNAGLAKALDKKGGVSFMVLSHIDDVGDHERWKKRFPDMVRVMHKADVKSYGHTSNVEMQLDSESADGQIGGSDYWDLGEDLRVLHTPGHSRGSVTLVYSPSPAHNDNAEGGRAKPEGIAFTGDHLAISGRTGALTGFPRYGFDHAMQSESMELLARPEVNFRWILPGHGRMIRFNDDEDRISQIRIAAGKIKDSRE